MGWVYVFITIMSEIDSDYKKLWGEATKFLSLQAKYAKLTLTEKLVVMVSVLFFAMTLIVLCSGLLMHFSWALAELIAQYVGSSWLANLIVAGFYMVLMALAFALRRPLIYVPVSKFITKLLLTPDDLK